MGIGAHASRPIIKHAAGVFHGRVAGDLSALNHQDIGIVNAAAQTFTGISRNAAALQDQRALIIDAPAVERVSAGDHAPFPSAAANGQSSSGRDADHRALIRIQRFQPPVQRESGKIKDHAFPFRNHKACIRNICCQMIG